MALANLVTTVTIPANGVDTVNVHDQAGNLLNTADFNVEFQASGTPGPSPMTATTVPAITLDAAGFHFAPNAPPALSQEPLNAAH